MLQRIESYSRSELTELLLGILVFITGLIHLYVGIQFQSNNLLLAGAGYIGGLVLFYIGFKRVLLSILTVPYTAAQIYVYVSWFGFEFGALAGIDKSVQLVLILVSILYSAENFEGLGKLFRLD